MNDLMLKAERISAHDLEVTSNREVAKLIRDLLEHIEIVKKQRDGLANFNPDWDMLEATKDSLREHMELAGNLKKENTILRFYKNSHTCLGCRGEAEKCLCGEYREYAS